MLEPLRIALAGFGYWGPNYARVFSEAPNTRISAVCELSSEGRQRAGARLPDATTSDNWNALLRRGIADAAVISTPASTHFRLTSAALEAGLHVLVEKPLALTFRESEQLCKLAEDRGRVLMVAHTFLYNAGIRKMKECLLSPEFGTVYYLHATRTNLGPIRHDVNALWDLAPHDVSIFHYLLGRNPEWASVTGSPVLGNTREDVVFATIGYPHGVIGNIHVSWADPNKVREVVAVGSGRRVVFDDLSDLERVRIFEKGVAVKASPAESFGEFKLLMRDGDILSPRIPPSEPLKNQCAEFLACIREGCKPVSDGRFGLAVVETLVAMEASMHRRGAACEVSRWKAVSS